MRQSASTWAVATILWVAYAVTYAGQIVDMAPGVGGERLTFPVALQIGLIAMVPFCVPVTVALLGVARRLPLTRATWITGLGKLGIIVVAVLAARAVYVWAVVNPSLYYVHRPWYEAGATLAGTFVPVFLYYHITVLVTLGACYAWVYVQNAQATRQRIAELEAGLTQARLGALAAQLNPHFLFNALNSIAELVHVDPQAADRMLVALSALLRRSLSNPNHEVTVDEEAALAAQYLSIEQVRLGERLTVEWSIDPSCAQALVPALVLQPLAENAIVHGIARRRAPGVLHIAVERAGARLALEVRADGPPADTALRERGNGIGLANTQARLRCLYGDDWSLTLDTGDDARSVVRIELPLHYAPSPVAAAAERTPATAEDMPR